MGICLVALHTYFSLLIVTLRPSSLFILLHLMTKLSSRDTIKFIFRISPFYCPFRLCKLFLFWTQLFYLFIKHFILIKIFHTFGIRSDWSFLKQPPNATGWFLSFLVTHYWPNNLILSYVLIQNCVRIRLLINSVSLYIIRKHVVVVLKPRLINEYCQLTIMLNDRDNNIFIHWE